MRQPLPVTVLLVLLVIAIGVALDHLLSPLIVHRPWASVPVAVVWVGFFVAALRLLGVPMTFRRPWSVFLETAVVLIGGWAAFLYADSLGPDSKQGLAISEALIFFGLAISFVAVMRGRS